MAKKKKGKKKVKKTAKQLEEEAAQKKQAIQDERENALEEQRLIIEREKRNNEEKVKYDAIEHETRLVQLEYTQNKFMELEDLMTDEELQERHLREWNLYIKDDRLPNPPVVPEMNTYLYKWHTDDSTYTMENIPPKTDEVLWLLGILEEFIDFPLNSSAHQIEIWKEVHMNFCSELLHHYDVATYRLLRFMEKNMVLTGLNEFSFEMVAKNFQINLWSIMPLPKPMIEPPLAPRNCVFHKIGVTLTIPEYLNKIDYVVRTLYLNYDHFSKQCPTSEPVILPEEMRKNLKERSVFERDRLRKIQQDVVNVRLEKLNFLRKALIDQATEINAAILEDQNTKDKKKKPEKKKNKKTQKGEAQEKKQSMRRQEEYIKSLMRELDLLPKEDQSMMHASKSSKSSLKSGKSGKIKFEKSPKKGEATTDAVGNETSSTSKDEEQHTSVSSKGSDSGKGSRKSRGKKGKKGGPEKEFWHVMDRLQSIPLNKTASVVFCEEEDAEDPLLEDLTNCQPDELNLRKYVILGGIIHLDLFILLSQPYEHPEKYIISIIKMPVGLQEVTEEQMQSPEEIEDKCRTILSEKVESVGDRQTLTNLRKSLLLALDTAIDDDTTGKDEAGDGKKSTSGEKKDSKARKEKRKSTSSVRISRVSTLGPRGSKRTSSIRRSSAMDMSEEERKMMRLSSMITDREVEEAESPFARYPLVKVTLKDDITYFENPCVVLWNEEKKYWSTDYCIHVKEEGKNLSFELKRCGPLALATLRYSNMPYQSWDMRPCLEDHSVQLTIRAKYLYIVFKIKENLVCITDLKKMPNKSLDNEIGNYYRPRALIQLLRSKGVDLFPDYDAYHHVEGSSPKYSVMEEHLYHCMALISGSYNFLWSRWNMQAGHRKIVILLREYLDRWHPITTSTLVVTPKKVAFVESTEWCSSFNEEFLPNMKFYADLNQLMQEKMSMTSQKATKDISHKQIETVFEMLCQTKVISYTTTFPEKEKVEFVSHQKAETPPRSSHKKKKKGKSKKKKKKDAVKDEPSK